MNRRFYDHMGIVPTDYILCYDFDNDYQDKSVNSLHGIKTGDSVFEDGLKGKKCLKFTNGCVRTPSVLPLNSDKVSISFWIKTSQTSTGIVAEMSENFNVNNAFGLLLNDGVANSIRFADHNSSGYNLSTLFNQLPMPTFTHHAILVDRSLISFHAKFYVNNVLKSHLTERADLSGNWVNNILFIGQRNASSIPFVGSLQNLKIYNRVLTRQEILGLSKELL